MHGQIITLVAHAIDVSDVGKFPTAMETLKTSNGQFPDTVPLVYNKMSTMSSVYQGPTITQQKQSLKSMMILTVEMLQLYLMEELLGGIPHLEKRWYGPLLID